MLRLLRIVLLLGLLGVTPGRSMAQEDGDGSPTNFCAPDQAPVYSFGFADLKAYVGDAMGDAVTCEYGDPSGSGDVLQQTTTGAAVFRASTSFSVFSIDASHWAITPNGGLSWVGDSLDPPPDLVAALLPPDPGPGVDADQAPPSGDSAPQADPVPTTQPTDVAGASVMWGAYIANVPAQGTGALDALESQLGKKMSIIHWGQSWGKPAANRFQTSRFDAVRAHGAIPMIDWFSFQLNVGNDQPDFRLATIANGTYDAYISQWAQDARDWGHPFFMRFDAEMNGWWLPWSEQLNGNHPGDFVRAWRHVVDVFRAQGATNVTWVWCPNISSNQSTPLAEMYPGDDYVDWTCLDGYNFGTTNGNHWQTFGQVYGGPAFGDPKAHNSYQEMLSVAPSKPIVLGEVSSSENGGSKGTWITDMLQSMPTTFPQIKAIVWMDWNSGDGNKTWPLDSSRESMAAFANGIASPVYSSNQFGSLGGGIIEPLAANAAGPPILPNPLSLSPVADTFTSRRAPATTSAGSSATLNADENGTDTAFLMFDLQPLAGKNLTSVTLRLHTSGENWAGSTATFDVHLVSATNWKEEYLTFNNNVPVSGTVLGTLDGKKNANSWYDISLNASALQGMAGKRLSVALTGRTSDVLIFNSREAGASVAPQLVVGYSG